MVRRRHAKLFAPLAEEFLQRAILFVTEVRDEWYENSQSVKKFTAMIYSYRRKWPLWKANVTRLSYHPLLRRKLPKLLDKELRLLKDEAEYVTRRPKEKLKIMKEAKNFPPELIKTLNQFLIMADMCLGYRILDEAMHKIVAFAKNLGSDKFLAKAHQHLSYPADENSKTKSASRLPFKHDSHYVLYGPVKDVGEALEDKDTTVVILRGESGLGKTTLVREFALHLVSSREKSGEMRVLYLQCGENPPIGQLQLDLLSMLKPSIPTESIDPSNSLKRLLCQSKQKLLIILDDVWDQHVLNNLVVKSNREKVTYLVTSQIPLVWESSKTVEMTHPDMNIARAIVSKYMEGLQIQNDGQQKVIDKLIHLVDKRPLSLSNVAIFVNTTSRRRPDVVYNSWLVGTQQLIWLLSPDEEKIEQIDDDTRCGSASTQRSVVIEFGRLAERPLLSLSGIGIFAVEGLHDQHQREETKERLLILMQDLLWDLGPEKESDRQDEAYKPFQSILIKLIICEDLDDCDMANLLMKQRTTTLACRALEAIIHSWFWEIRFIQSNESFARLYVQTMTALLKVSKCGQNADQLQKVSSSEAAATRVLEQVLRPESEDAIEGIVKHLSDLDGEILQRREELVRALQALSKSRDGSKTFSCTLQKSKEPIPAIKRSLSKSTDGSIALQSDIKEQPTRLKNMLYGFEPVEPLLVRGDVRDMEFQFLDQNKVPLQVLTLYKVSMCESTRRTVLKLVFSRVQGMARIIGIGLHFSEVLVDHDFRITVEEMLESRWKRLWGDEGQLEGYKRIIFEGSEGSAGIESFEAQNHYGVNTEYLQFNSTWRACAEQLFGAETPFETEDHSHDEVSPSENPENAPFGKQMTTNDPNSSSTSKSKHLGAGTASHDQKISGQDPSTSSSSQVSTSVHKGEPIKLNVKIILNQFCSQVFALNADGSKKGPETVDEQDSVRGERRTNVEERSEATGTQRDSGEREANDKHSEIGPGHAETDTTQTSEITVEQRQGTRTPVNVQTESSQVDSSEPLGIIKPEITIGFNCDYAGESTLEANVKVDYQLNDSSDGYRIFHDKLYLSFGCENLATIDMSSRSIESEYGDIESQTHSDTSQSFKFGSQAGGKGSFQVPGAKAGLGYDRKQEESEGQQEGNRETAAVKAAYLKGTKFWVEPKNFKDYLRFEAKLPGKLASALASALASPGASAVSRLLSEDGRFHHAGTFSSIPLFASAEWTPERGGMQTWVFHAEQALHKVPKQSMLTSTSTDRKPKKKINFIKLSFKNRHHKTSRGGRSDSPVFSYRQEYRKEFLINHDFSHIDVAGVITRLGLQDPKNQRTPVLRWSLKIPEPSKAPELLK